MIILFMTFHASILNEATVLIPQIKYINIRPIIAHSLPMTAHGYHEQVPDVQAYNAHQGYHLQPTAHTQVHTNWLLSFFYLLCVCFIVFIVLLYI